MYKVLCGEEFTSVLRLAKIPAVNYGEQTGSSKSGRQGDMLELCMVKATAWHTHLSLETTGHFCKRLTKFSTCGRWGGGGSSPVSSLVHKIESGVYPRIALESAGEGHSLREVRQSH